MNSKHLTIAGISAGQTTFKLKHKGILDVFELQMTSQSTTKEFSWFFNKGADKHRPGDIQGINWRPFQEEMFHNFHL